MQLCEHVEEQATSEEARAALGDRAAATGSLALVCQIQALDQLTASPRHRADVMAQIGGVQGDHDTALEWY